MTALLGKKAFEDILGGLTYKPPGKPVLVTADDKRPEFNSAYEDFDENQGGKLIMTKIVNPTRK